MVPAVIDPEDMLDERDPASDLEEREARETAEETVDRPAEDYAAAIGRVLAWFLEGQNLQQIGLRVLVAIHKLRPDLIGGMSFAEIAGQAGFCRSAAHNLSLDFEKNFPVRGIHDRSAIARAAYRKSHHKAGQVNSSTGRAPWLRASSQPVRSRSKA